MALSACISKIDKTGLELVEHGTLDFPIACYHDDLSRLAVDWHWHEELEFIYVSEGSSIISIDNHRFIAEKGEGFFINSGVLHSCWDYQGSNCRYHSIVFHPGLVGGTPDSIFWNRYLHPILNSTATKYLHLKQTLPWQDFMLSTIDTVWHLCQQEPVGYEFEVRSHLSKLIYELSCHLTEENEGFSSQKIRNNTRMKQMLQFIHTHYSEPITIGDIANCASLSESECLRCFKNTIETTPIQYVKSYRLKKAARLLTNTDEKIIDIGIRCGFQDMSYFSKVFRETYGATPLDYRKKESQKKIDENANTGKEISL